MHRDISCQPADSRRVRQYYVWDQYIRRKCPIRQDSLQVQVVAAVEPDSELGLLLFGPLFTEKLEVFLPRKFTALRTCAQNDPRRIRNYMITVEHVDSYTGDSCPLLFRSILRPRANAKKGMVKFNCGGSGLTPGLQSQVERLVEVMRLASEILSLHVDLRDGSKSRNSTARGQMYPIPARNTSLNPQSVLQPFMRLRGLRHLVVEGAVSADFSDELEKQITLPQQSR
jgi:hypothetical protein